MNATVYLNTNSNGQAYLLGFLKKKKNNAKNLKRSVAAFKQLILIKNMSRQIHPKPRHWNVYCILTWLILATCNKSGWIEYVVLCNICMCLCIHVLFADKTYVLLSVQNNINSKHIVTYTQMYTKNIIRPKTFWIISEMVQTAKAPKLKSYCNIYAILYNVCKDIRHIIYL